MADSSKSSIVENGNVHPGVLAVRPGIAPRATIGRGVSAAGEEYELTCVGQFLIVGDDDFAQFPVAPLKMTITVAQASCVLVTGHPKFRLSIFRCENLEVELCRWFPTPTGMLYPLSLLPGKGRYVLRACARDNDAVWPCNVPQAETINLGDG